MEIAQLEQPTRVALIGIGDAGFQQGRALNALQQTSEVTWVGSVARDSSTYTDFCHHLGCATIPQQFSSLEELINRHIMSHKGFADVAVIATPDHLHYEQTMTCLKHGIAVLVEKPLTNNTAAAQGLYETAQSRNLLLRTGYHHRYHVGHLLLKQCINKLGTFEHAELAWSWRDRRRESWRGSSLSPAWAIAALGTHLIDFASWLTNDKLDVHGARQFPPDGTDHTIDVYGSLGESTSFHLKASIDVSEPSRLLLFGRDAAVRSIGTFGARGAGHIELIHKRQLSTLAFTPVNPYENQLRSFINDHMNGFEADPSLIGNVVAIEEIKQKLKEGL